ncbi:type II toxin-antitoxin system death-on-curing family toxin [Patescibacteria group bacterium]|nr:type II toxin-antitoxin system death-on-curing family toxin [Patescibacteria group bacterium]
MICKNQPKQSLNKGDIIIYQSKNGEVDLEVNLREETVWLTQAQIALLFGAERSVVTKHLRNIFESKELNKNSVCAKIAHTAADEKTYKTQFYNLDMIISVGYRVNSKRATQFRIWATGILKQHILQGYTINQKRLLETKEKFRELQNAVSFLQEKSKKELFKGQEREILNLLSAYSKTLTILEQYDKDILKKPKGKKSKTILKYKDCLKIIAEIKKELIIKKEASDLFGNETANKFESIIKNLYQTFDRKELYKTIEEKAAHLLYLTIKDHPFSDGNKRIGSFLFVYFLDKNNYLYRKTGEKKINDNTLIALVLLIAESNSKEKDVLIKIIANLIVN